MADNICVEVVYATPAKQWLLEVGVLPNATVEEAIKASGLLAQVPEIDLSTCDIGIWGKRCAVDAALKAGDRIEIYRPLIIDPKEMRRRRAALKEKMEDS